MKEQWGRYEVLALELKAYDNGVEFGKLQERERIIALLEDLRNSEYAEVMTHDDLIALIKGANK